MKNYTILFLLGILIILLSFKTFPSSTPELCEHPSFEHYGIVLNTDPLSEEYLQYLSWLEQEHGLPEGLLFVIMMKESSGDPIAVSSAGAEGLFQIMPNTSNWLQIDPFNPYEAGSGAAKYLKYLIKHFDGSLELGLAAYHAGMGNVRKYNNTVPPFEETQQYVSYITRRINS